MIQFVATWDGATYAQLAIFSQWDLHMGTLLWDLAKEYGEAGVKYIKPEVRGNGRWQPSTGKTADGIGYEYRRGGTSGFTLNFLGENMSEDGRHNIADMLDVGNFPASQAMYANQHGLKAFPISARAGNVTDYFAVIHGMGHSSPEYPKNFSEGAMTWLCDNTPNLAEKHMQAFLDRLVI